MGDEGGGGDEGDGEAQVVQLHSSCSPLCVALPQDFYHPSSLILHPPLSRLAKRHQSLLQSSQSLVRLEALQQGRFLQRLHRWC